MKKQKKYKASLYFYWREVQRKQLGYSANLFFLFASGLLAFTLKELNIVNYLICETSCKNFPLIVSIVFCVCSIVLYGLFSYNRLHDFRSTARLYKSGLSIKKVSEMTSASGKNSWILFKLQLTTLTISFLALLIYLIIKYA